MRLPKCHQFPAAGPPTMARTSLRWDKTKRILTMVATCPCRQRGMLPEHRDAEQPRSREEVCYICTRSGVTVTPHVILGQAHGVTLAGNKSEPSPCNTLGMELESARPISFPDDLNLELASFPNSFFSRRLGKFCSGRSLLPDAAEHLAGASRSSVRQLPLFWQQAHPHRPHTGRWIPPLLCQLLGRVPTRWDRACRVLFNSAFPGNKETQSPQLRNSQGLCTRNRCLVPILAPS